MGNVGDESDRTAGVVLPRIRRRFGNSSNDRAGHDDGGERKDEQDSAEHSGVPFGDGFIAHYTPDLGYSLTGLG